MYAHQVIEDFNKYEQIASDKHWHKKLLSPLIIYSQKFHLGDVSDIRDIAGHLGGKPLFQNKSFLKLPFPVCWFDYSNTSILFQKKKHYQLTNSKEAVLVDGREPDKLWVFAISYYAEFSSWIPLPVTAEIYINNYGENVRLSTIKGSIQDKSDELKKHLFSDFSLNLEMLELTLKLLSCKNIQSEIIKAPDVLNKKRIRNGKQPIFDYHVLNVVVPSKKRGCANKSAPLSHNRVHLCRGHFKEYTQDHPLFGKYTGLYWWQPHVRGQNKDGIVMKDYNVEVK